MPVTHVYHGPKRSVDVGVRSAEQSIDIKVGGFCPPPTSYLYKYITFHMIRARKCFCWRYAGIFMYTLLFSESVAKML